MGVTNILASNTNCECVYYNEQLTLRAGSPIPRIASSTSFVLHTFGMEKNNIKSFGYTNSLPSSSEFRGQGGNYMSASFNRLQDISGEVFQGRIVENTIYLDEGPYISSLF